MKKHSILFASIFALFMGILTSCDNLSNSGNEEKSAQLAGKATVHLGLSQAERTIMPTAMTEDDIKRLEFKAEKLGSGQEYAEYTFSDGKSSLEWNSISSMKDSSVELDFGTYNFTLNIYAESGEERLTQTATLSEFEVNASTSTIDFGKASYVDNGDFKITLVWVADSEDKSRIGLVEAELYEIASDSSIGSLLESPAITTTTPESSTNKDGGKVYSTISSAASVPNGSYFLKIKIYDNESKILNTIIDIVKIHGFKTEKTLTLDLDKINIPYYVYYNLNGGTWADSSDDFSKNTKRNAYTSLLLPDASDLSFFGYTFAGWYEGDSSGNATNTDAEGNPVIITKIGAGMDTAKDYTLWAKWSENAGSSAVVYVNDSEEAYDSITSALAALNDSSVDYTIYIDGTLTVTTSINPSNVTNAKSITLIGKNANGTDTLDGKSGGGSVLTIATDIPVTIKNLKITGGTYGRGGGLFIAEGSTVTLADGAVITGNTAGTITDCLGGGVYNEGTLFMYGTAVIGEDKNALPTAVENSNSAYYGGGLYNAGSVYLGYSGWTDGIPVEAELTGGIFYNYAVDGGGAIFNAGTLNIKSGFLSYNYTPAWGGGIRTAESGSAIVMTGGTISHNANNNNMGGGVILRGGTFNMAAGEISYNIAGSGGGISITDAAFTMTGGSIKGNTNENLYYERGSGATIGGTSLEEGCCIYDDIIDAVYSGGAD